MEKYKILAQFVKDISCETKDIQTFLFVKDYISKYSLTIDIDSKATKNKLIEINTTLKFEDKENSEKKSHFEIKFATIIKTDENNSLIYLKGSIPGSRNSEVIIKKAVKNIRKLTMSEKIENIEKQKKIPDKKKNK